MLRTIIISLCCCFYCHATVELGVDVFFSGGQIEELRGKRVGLITNHTGIDSKHRTDIELFKQAAGPFHLAALFCPEHGLNGLAYAAEKVDHATDSSGIPIYSLHGSTRRPTEAMLKEIDVLIYDIQEVGSRSYTYVNTLFYVMEEAAKHNIEVIVLDRPNPMGGLVVDGPLLDPDKRSFLGYISVPYCHGMTVGELALFFNSEYKVGCPLKIVPMRGWSREMSFKDTGLHWIPTSPNIPEPDTPFFYATTGILGELGLVSIGIGYTLPFKVVGAPWIDAEEFAYKLNGQHFPGVHFYPFYFRPFSGAYKDQDCAGVKIAITDPLVYRPLAVQFLLLGMLKSLYPKEVEPKLHNLPEAKKQLFCRLSGTDAILDLILKEKYIAWKLIDFQRAEREAFLELRHKYLLYK